MLSFFKAPFLVSDIQSFKRVDAVFELYLTNIVKTFKKGWGVFKLFFYPVELGSLELTGAQPNCFGFSSLMSMFWSFLMGMHWEEMFIIMYVCIGWKPFWISIVLSLFNKWVGFAHFEVGVGCIYFSLAQWIKMHSALLMLQYAWPDE